MKDNKTIKISIHLLRALNIHKVEFVVPSVERETQKEEGEKGKCLFTSALTEQACAAWGKAVWFRCIRRLCAFIGAQPPSTSPLVSSRYLPLFHFPFLTIGSGTAAAPRT